VSSRSSIRFPLLVALTCLGFSAWGQAADLPEVSPPPPPPAADAPPPVEEPPPPPVRRKAADPTVTEPPREDDPAEDRLKTRTMPPLQEKETPEEAAPPLDPHANDPAYLDGMPRKGAFLAGPGSLTFVMHHTLMGAAGGLATQGVTSNFRFQSAREAMLIGTLIGAGMGFASSAWWQANHWIDTPMANFGVVASLVSGMFFAGMMDLMSDDPLALAWSAFVGAEVGGWLTAAVAGGKMPVNHALFVSSGAAWGLAYGALLMAIIGTSGTTLSSQGVADALLVAPGIGAGLMALTTLTYTPTSAQVLRGDLFGAGVGGAVLVLSALVIGGGPSGFSSPTPYVLSMLSSIGAIAAVTLLWEESAEAPRTLAPRASKQPYKNIWW
jgi:hypothetical protein